MAEVIVRLIDRVAEEALQPVPGGKNLRYADFSNNAPVAIESDPPVNLDSEAAGSGAAFVKRRQKFWMAGDTSAATRPVASLSAPTISRQSWTGNVRPCSPSFFGRRTGKPLFPSRLMS
jgi:hypothetical protein